MPALKPMGVSGVPPKHVRALTQQEDALLVGLYPSHTVPELTKHFQRTGPAIRSRIRLLLSQGLSTPNNPLNTKELNTLIRNRHTKTIRELANELGRSTSTVGLNLRKRGYRFRKYGGTPPQSQIQRSPGGVGN